MADNTSINQFLGLNMSESGATNLKLGEASSMVNFRITKDYKLDKMYGYEFIQSLSDKPIRAIWIGNLNGTDINIYVTNGKIYKGSTQIGTLTDDVTSIFEFNKALYFLNGHEYKKYDGTSVTDVSGYVPLVKTACTPGGEGTDLELINVLTPKRKVEFSSDGETKTYQLPETNLASINSVEVDGTAVTNVTKSTTNGTVTFTTSPTQGVNNVVIEYSVSEDISTIVKANYYSIGYGLADDNRIFMYGDKENKNRVIFSGLADGVASAEYFPATNFIDIGSSNTAVTNISRQYDRLIISKENETYYSTYEALEDDSGETIIAFPTYPLNTSHGMVAKGQGQLLDNYVTTIDTSIVQWTNTESRDERNASIISNKVKEWLDNHDLTKTITIDYQEDSEYWLNIENEALIYNYSNGCFYLLQFPIKFTFLYVADKDIYFGTENGKIGHFSKSILDYGGEKISCEWQSGYYDFGYEEYRKTMRTIWITLKPYSKTSLEVAYVSDRDSSSENKEIENSSYSYKYFSYDNFSYKTTRGIKPFKVKLKAKKFAFLKLILSNARKERLTINSIAIKKTIGGEVK